MAHLDAALALEPDHDGRWRAHADPDHESISSMFGGWTAAVLLRAVLATAASAAELVPTTAVAVTLAPSPKR